MLPVLLAQVLLRYLAGTLAIVAGHFVWRHAPKPFGWILGPLPLLLWLAGELLVHSSSLAVPAPLTPPAVPFEIGAPLVGMWLAMWAEKARTGRELRDLLQRIDDEERQLKLASCCGGPFRSDGRLIDPFDF